MVETVSGKISAEELGFVLMHEHLYVGNWNNRMADPQWMDYEDVIKNTTRAVLAAKEKGVQTIVDVTPMNIGRDIHVLKEVSEATGVKIVAATGMLYDETNWVQRIKEENLVKMFVREATEGVQGTDIKCGIIKCGTNQYGLTPANQKILRACARAQKELNIPLMAHCRPSGRRYGLFQQDIFEENGADLSKVIICHFRYGDGDPLDYAEDVMRRGSYITIDMNEASTQLRPNMEAIVKLVEKGWEDHLILDHDAVICFNDTRYEDMIDENQNFTYILTDVIPELKNRGITEEQIEKIFVKNPQRIFGVE